MVNYSTLGHNQKRGIFNFCHKLTKKMKRPVQKFILDMVFGLIAARNCLLSEIARKLNEDIALDKTVERLSRNLMCFEDSEALHEHYFASVSKGFDKRTVLIVDDSDIAKSCSRKLEGLCKVHDGSTGEIPMAIGMPAQVRLRRIASSPSLYIAGFIQARRKGIQVITPRPSRHWRFCQHNFQRKISAQWTEGMMAGLFLTTSSRVTRVSLFG